MRFSKLQLAGLLMICLVGGDFSSQAGWFSKKKKEPVVPAPVTNFPPVVVAPPTNPPPVEVAIAPPTNEPPVLAWDADMKEYHAKLGDPTANVSFFMTNASPVDAVVSSVTTSCGCTTAHLPPLPWTIKPGESGEIGGSVNLAGKSGTLIKTLTVHYNGGQKALQIHVFMPDPQLERQQNMVLAQGDRQAVFKDTCARCHAVPAEGKTGEALFHAVCGVCHESANRASMVPDLHALKNPTDRAFWTTWIATGKPGSLMPAFAKAQGGPLTDEQIASLVDYLVTAIPSAVTNEPAAH